MFHPEALETLMFQITALERERHLPEPHTELPDFSSLGLSWDVALELPAGHSKVRAHAETRG